MQRPPLPDHHVTRLQLGSHGSQVPRGDACGLPCPSRAHVVPEQPYRASRAGQEDALLDLQFHNEIVIINK
jgi:hypothetical protein